MSLMNKLRSMSIHSRRDHFEFVLKNSDQHVEDPNNRAMSSSERDSTNDKVRVRLCQEPSRTPVDLIDGDAGDAALTLLRLNADE